MKSSLTRCITAVIYGAAMIAGMIINEYVFLALMIAILGLTMNEFFNLSMRGKFLFSQTMAILCGEIILLGTFCICKYSLEGKYLLLAFIPLFVLFCNGLATKETNRFGEFSYIFTSIPYIVLPLTAINFLVFDNGVWDALPLLGIFILIWVGDTGAYVFGMSLGQKHGPKLAPTISPKKTWIGAIGGFVTVLLASWLLTLTPWFEVHGVQIPWYHALGIGTVIYVAGVIGDLVESQWKRFFQVKDSGHGMPGHGGFLDRFDSALLAIPMAIVYLVIFQFI